MLRCYQEVKKLLQKELTKDEYKTVELTPQSKMMLLTIQINGKTLKRSVSKNLSADSTTFLNFRAELRREVRKARA